MTNEINHNEALEAACAHDTDGWFDRRTLLRVAAIGAAAASVVGFGEAAPANAASWTKSLGKLKIGYLPITDASPLLYGHGKGIFADVGIDTETPKLFRSWPSLVEAFQAKQLDVVHLLMPLAIQLKFAAKQDIKVITWNHTNGSALTVAKSINNFADLAGKTVAIPFWYSIHNVVLQQLFRAEGLTPVLTGDASAAKKTVKLVVLAPADMPTALSNGQVAGYIVADPFNAVAEVKGFGKILRFTGDVWREHACCVTVVRGDLIKKNPAAAIALTEAIVRSQLAIRNDRDAAASLFSSKGYLPQPLPAIKKALNDYSVSEYKGAIKHPEWKSARIDFKPFPFPSYTTALITELKKTKVDGDASFLGKINLKTAHADLVAVGLAEKAIAENGGTKKFDLPAKLTRTEVIKP
jgi:NitT/TauT family transport system substrate-binding protein